MDISSKSKQNKISVLFCTVRVIEYYLKEKKDACHSNTEVLVAFRRRPQLVVTALKIDQRMYLVLYFKEQYYCCQRKYMLVGHTSKLVLMLLVICTVLLE